MFACVYMRALADRVWFDGPVVEKPLGNSPTDPPHHKEIANPLYTLLQEISKH